MSNYNKIGHFDGIVLGSNTTNQVLYTTYQTEITLPNGSTTEVDDNITNNKGAFLPIAVGIHIIDKPNNEITIDMKSGTDILFDDITLVTSTGFKGIYQPNGNAANTGKFITNGSKLKVKPSGDPGAATKLRLTFIGFYMSDT